MGFPLNQGTVKDGILTCHWHHARFDLMNGGTFDQWAGDVTSFPVEIRNQNEVWIDVSPAVVADTDSLSSSSNITREWTETKHSINDCKDSHCNVRR